MRVGVPGNEDVLFLKFPTFLLHGPYVDHDASTHSQGASHLLYCSNTSLFGGQMMDDCEKNMNLSKLSRDFFPFYSFYVL